jgi:hypothetical protein
MAQVSAKRLFVPVVLAMALAAVALAMRGKGRLPDTPESAVRAFFAAAQEGDSAAYLSVISGPLKNSIGETQSQLGGKAFRESLRNSVAGLKGFAVSRSSDVADDRVALEVELVFADRSERQRFGLVRESRGWSIATLDRAEVEKPAAAYGAPVYGFAPAGDNNPESTPTDAALRGGP